MLRGLKAVMISYHRLSLCMPHILYASTMSRPKSVFFLSTSFFYSFVADGMEESGSSYELGYSGILFSWSGYSGWERLRILVVTVPCWAV